MPHDVPHKPAFFRYGIAALISVGALGLRLWLGFVLGPTLPFVLFYPAIALSAFVGGLGPGVLSTFLCALAGEYFLIEPRGSFGVASTGDAIGLVIFGLVGVLISALFEGRRHNAQRAHRSEERLRLTLLSISDAVITTDAAGVITHMNPVAEAMTGYSAAAARERRLTEVLVLRDEPSGENVCGALVERSTSERRVLGASSTASYRVRDARSTWTRRSHRSSSRVARRRGLS
jgi:PAS domain-containing protein